MQVLIINLDRSTDRLAFQHAQMTALGLSYTRVPAVNAKELNLNEADPYWNRWERPMRISEKACFLSHRAVWEQISKGDEPVLVLEDDAVLSHKVPALLERYQNREDLDHLTLETRGRKKLMARRQTSDPAVTRLYLDRSGAAAYILWPSGAQKLLAKTSRQAAIADAAICATYSLRSFQAEPALAVQLDFCDHYGVRVPLQTASSIFETRPRSSNVFLLRRVIAQMRQGLRQLSHMSIASHRHATIKIEDFAYIGQLDLSPHAI
jgi:glycosyl transferase, family 25